MAGLRRNADWWLALACAALIGCGDDGGTDPTDAGVDASASDGFVEPPEDASVDSSMASPDAGMGEADAGEPTCPEEMTLVVRTDRVFCVDSYEASRSDATTSSPGSADSMAHSQAGVMPWADISLADAAAACEAAGKRLCTAAEWGTSCGGSAGFLYPYDESTYSATTCNGIDRGVGAAAPTGSHPSCTSPDGIFDLSGNLEEWVSDGQTRGGSYEDSSASLTCTGEEGPTAPSAAIGFRCCSDA